MCQRCCRIYCRLHVVSINEQKRKKRGYSVTALHYTTPLQSFLTQKGLVHPKILSVADTISSMQSECQARLYGLHQPTTTQI